MGKNSGMLILGVVAVIGLVFWSRKSEGGFATIFTPAPSAGPLNPTPQAGSPIVVMGGSTPASAPNLPGTYVDSAGAREAQQNELLAAGIGAGATFLGPILEGLSKRVQSALTPEVPATSTTGLSWSHQPGDTYAPSNYYSSGYNAAQAAPPTPAPSGYTSDATNTYVPWKPSDSVPTMPTMTMQTVYGADGTAFKTPIFG